MEWELRDFIQLLRRKNIPVYTPGELPYERSVATVNLLYRYARPDCVVQPQNAAQVQLIVRSAKARDIPMTIKNGGHSYSGASTAEKGISLDLTHMDGVKLEKGARLMTVQGGALWGHVYKEFVNQKINGYIVNGGRCPTVGVSGFILGGGLGPFTRSFGMGCDNVEDITIVTADGQQVTVKRSQYIQQPKSDKGSLFWALCGAGGGNFGVVVEMKLRVQKLRRNKVVAGRYTWYPNLGSTITGTVPEDLRAMMAFYEAPFPKELTIDTTWVCDLQESKDAIRFLVYYNGNKAEFDNVISDTISFSPLATQLKRRSLEEASSRFLHETLVAQWSEEIEKSFPQNPSFSIYASFVFAKESATTRKMTEIIREKMTAFREQFVEEKGSLQVTSIHGGGQAGSKASWETAFPWREGVYYTYITLQWSEKFLEQDMWDFLDDFKKRLRPYSLRGKAAFINFPDRTLANNRHEAAYYGSNSRELQQVKAVWDEDNYFQWKQGVRYPRAPRSERMDNYPIVASLHGATGIAFGAYYIESLNTAVEVPDDGDTWERPHADEIASRQWETVCLPPKKLYRRGDAINDLKDLGF
ncbi:hypothetical protein TgHK011_006909 [Trichoderma gracile]|nr:hypothetical protein TgHK011_006909 [Trichoderma gracile]